MGCPVLLAELAALAEDCGWDGVFCEDYIAFADRLDTYDVWITLGLMASATERVWMSYDPDDVSGLFSEDVASRYYPYGEPIVGRDAVVTSWLGEIASGDASTSDASGTYDAEYFPVAVDGDTVVATGSSRYRELPGGPVVRTYQNCFVIRFDGEGRCREFTEYYLRRP